MWLISSFLETVDFCSSVSSMVLTKPVTKIIFGKTDILRFPPHSHPNSTVSKYSWLVFYIIYSFIETLKRLWMRETVSQLQRAESCGFVLNPGSILSYSTPEKWLGAVLRHGVRLNCGEQCDFLAQHDFRCPSLKMNALSR